MAKFKISTSEVVNRWYVVEADDRDAAVDFLNNNFEKFGDDIDTDTSGEDIDDVEETDEEPSKLNEVTA